MNSLLLDGQAALRFFARRKAAFAMIVLTMALALGANTAVFSVLKAFLLSSLGVPDADRVMVVWTVRHIDGRGPVNFFDAHVNIELLRKTTHFWESLAASSPGDFNWQLEGDETRRLQGV